MTTIRSIAPALAATLLALGLALSSPALAKNDKTPPGDPCGSGPGAGTGNPCNGNQGNSGANGNAGGPAAPFEFDAIEMPSETDRGVFVTQIGQTNGVEANQSSGRSYARVVQAGDENDATITQRDSGSHYAAIVQDGDANRLGLTQEGSGQAVLMLAQEGDANSADVWQNEIGSTYSAAAISQSGTGNTLSLVQDGSSNQARLVQTGEDNAMTATQLGASNRLDWTQDGHGLSDLQIVQSGNAAMQIVQTNTGGG